MTLLEKSQHLFKVIREQPLLDEIREQVLTFKPKENGIGDKLYPMRLIGLLSQDPQKTDKVLSIIVSNLVKEFLSWNEEKRNILLDINKQIFQLNELCIAPLTKELAHYSFVLNPYIQFLDFLEYYELNTSIDYKKHLFSPKEAEEIANVFYETPAFKYALSTLPELTSNPLLIHSQSAVVKLNEDLINAGTRNDIDLFGILEEKKLNAYERHTISLLCIKDSLSNLNQLIYQAIIQDELTSVNIGDVFDYSIVWTESGTGIAVKYLISRGELWGIELSDLVALNFDYPGFDNSIGRIESHNSNIMSNNAKGNFEDTVDIEARIIDENLNAYGNFINKLNRNEKVSG